MIGYITGKILEISEHSILILPESGVGYEIGINEITFASLVGSEEVELYVYHHITEGGQSLFGFETLEEKKLFTELIKISGVGGKVAQQILSLGKHRLIEAVQQDDKKTIEGIKGIGKKMAEKIVLELKDKDFVKAYTGVGNAEENRVGDAGLHPTLPKDIRENIASTLQNMGYQNRDIERVMERVPQEFTSIEQILPFMIRELS
jgi:Holliday junction DNA helicase RuvA